MPITIPTMQDVIWDAGTSASILFGVLRVPLTKLSPGKITVKREKVRRVGESLARKRSPGSAEISDYNGEMLATDFEATLLPRLPQHGGTLVEFPILIRLGHPSVAGSLAVWMSETCITEFDGPELDGSSAEKGLIYKLQFSSMGRFDKGRDNVWKCLYFDPRRRASEAVPTIPF
jgi:hypothetical protein